MFSLFCLGIILLQQGIAVSGISKTKSNVLSVKQQRAVGGARWSYIGQKDGVNQWSRNYPTCGGKSQSPIIVEEFATRPTVLQHFKFHGYDTLRSGVSLKNDGHSAVLQLKPSDDKPYIEFGGLGANYTFDQLHFHWGLDDFGGSEHIIKSKFPTSLEAHFVHVNPNETMYGRPGIAVLGILFSTGLRDNSDYAPIVDKLEDIPYKGQKTVIKKSFYLDSLLPDGFHKSRFFRYNGSLTTPPCSEGVIWTVFKHVESIGREQMNKFRHLMKTPVNSANPKSMAPNYRPVQPLNNRRISNVRSVTYVFNNV